MIKSSLVQLKEAKVFRDTGISGNPFVGVAISSAGYQALGVSAKAPQPSDGGAFAGGMKSRASKLNDPPAQDLEDPYQGDIHAMVLIAADPDAADSWGSTQAENVGTQILNLMGASATVLTTEIGRAIFKDNGTSEDGTRKIEGIEHFGYVDGRSQPLMLRELIQREANESDGISVWDPSFPLGQVLVSDPGSPNRDTAFGSFFVFRKLEQDVAGFKETEEELGARADLGRQGALMGAMLVGRFEDGTPVVLQRDDGMDNPVANNFDYAGDPLGLRCPFHAHIRKVNPRGDSVREFGVDLAAERSHIMARRGMPYGRRDKIIDPTDQPSDGVGLMFMAFQNNLSNQFEFTQASWANNADFVRQSVGRDPIIGQRGPQAQAPLNLSSRWGHADTQPVIFEQFVKLRGGEYFFVPSISTLENL